MISQQRDTITLFFFENLCAAPGIKHFISGRRGGVSDNPYGSLNLGFHVYDDPAKVRTNRERLSAGVGVSLQDFVFCKQVHEGDVTCVTEGMRGHGALDQSTAIEATDGMITNVTNMMLTVLLADCVPVILYDPVNAVIGVAHAGWKGTVRFVARNTVEQMKKEFKSNPKDILVGIGPSIGPEAYEVGQDVIQAVQDAFPFWTDVIRTADGRICFDLWESNRRQLVDIGVKPENIEVATICTRRSSDAFFSERLQKPTGRFGAGIIKTP